MKRVYLSIYWIALITIGVVFTACGDSLKPDIRPVLILTEDGVITNSAMETNYYRVVNISEFKRLPVGSRVIVKDVPGFGEVKGTVAFDIILNTNKNETRLFLTNKVLQMGDTAIRNGVLVTNKAMMNVETGKYVVLDIFFMREYLREKTVEAYGQLPDIMGKGNYMNISEEAKVADFYRFEPKSKVYRWAEFTNLNVMIGTNEVDASLDIVRAIGRSPNSLGMGLKTELSDLELVEVIKLLKKWDLTIQVTYNWFSSILSG